MSFSSKGSCWAQLRGKKKKIIRAFLLRGNFFLLKMALHSWTEYDNFCRSKMGMCFPKPTYYSCLPLAVELPERMLSASSLLSSVLWRPCRPPALGTAVTGHKKIPEMSYNQSCLATAAGELLGGPAPSGHLCWQLWYLCSSLQLAVWVST